MVQAGPTKLSLALGAKCSHRGGLPVTRTPKVASPNLLKEKIDKDIRSVHFSVTDEVKIK